jgi:hypothetical protein
LKERSDLDSETRDRKPWTRQIKYKWFEAVWSKCSGRNSDEAMRKASGKGNNERERRRKTRERGVTM